MSVNWKQLFADPAFAKELERKTRERMGCEDGAAKLYTIFARALKESRKRDLDQLWIENPKGN